MKVVPNRFAGKVVVVTGAGHGIGQAIAERFFHEGASVVVNDVHQARIDEVVNALGAVDPQRAMGYAADVSNSALVEKMFQVIGERFGLVDILVNNAGLIYESRHFLEGDEAWWDRVLDVNLKGTFLCSHAVARAMAERGSGNIINMSSGGATKAHRGNVAYDASKGGIEAMTRAMALDLAPYGIRVNALVPGFIRTYDITDEGAAVRAQSVPLGRLGTGEDLAGSAVFLASDDADYITGFCLAVDGGVLVQQRPMPVETFPLSRFPKLNEK
jgi:NAD(P)-dependent dehydrogenase (short-subunit alcohol dehydrogenase family)